MNARVEVLEQFGAQTDGEGKVTVRESQQALRTLVPGNLGWDNFGTVCHTSPLSLWMECIFECFFSLDPTLNNKDG